MTRLTDLNHPSEPIPGIPELNESMFGQGTAPSNPPQGEVPRPRRHGALPMTSELLARLCLMAAWKKPGGATPKQRATNQYDTLLEAATHIEALEARVREVETERDAALREVLSWAKDAGTADAWREIAEQTKDRVRELEGGLEPFAKAGSIAGERNPYGDFYAYRPAAGDEYAITGDHLRNARRLLTPEKTDG